MAVLVPLPLGRPVREVPTLLLLPGRKSTERRLPEVLWLFDKALLPVLPGVLSVSTLWIPLLVIFSTVLTVPAVELESVDWGRRLLALLGSRR